MKNFKLRIQKQTKWICLVVVLTLFAILINMSQTIQITERAFHFGEMILVMLNDSYTGYYVFPFLLGFLVMGIFRQEQNIGFQLIRYGSRQKFFYGTIRNLITVTFLYFALVVAFSFLSGIGNSKCSLELSEAFREYAEIYLLGEPDSDYLLLEIIKTVLLRFELFLFYAMLQYSMLQLFHIKIVSFLLYNGFVFVIAAMALGYFGSIGEMLSVDSISGAVVPGGAGYILRFGILAMLDFILLCAGKYVFVNCDISLPKGDKQYQEE